MGDFGGIFDGNPDNYREKIVTKPKKQKYNKLQSFKQMKKIISILVTIIFLLSSCEKVLIEKDPAVTPTANFEALWQTADEKYSFFEYKGIDWNEIYSAYRPQIDDNMTGEQLFDVLGSMLNELKDGHVNLTSPFNISRYSFNYPNPENFNYRLLKDNYIGWDYNITGPLVNAFIERDGHSIGYIYYGSFSNNVSSYHIDYVINRFRNSDGIILDMRSNGGGSVSNIRTIAGRFTNVRRFVYTSALKDGPEHNDFGEPSKVYLDPRGSKQYTGKVMFLTNRGSFSATSFFSVIMKALPNVTQIGDTTGGGLGAPTGFELPNGWAYRFSCSQTLTPAGENFENGVPPDITVWMNPEHELQGIDDIMERAIEEILK